MERLLHAVVTGAVAVAMSLASGDAWGRSFSLDLRSAGAAKRSVAANHSGPAMSYATDGILRSFNLDAGVADVGEVAVGDELAFTLFDDVAITLTLKVKAASPLGGDVFLAEASGYDGVKNAVVIRTADGLTIDVQDYRNGKQYKVLSTANGVSVIEQDASKTGKCGCDSEGFSVGEDIASQKAHTPSSINGAPVARSGDPTYVDILVAYDANAKAWVDANGGGMLTFAQLAVQKMNTVLYNNELYEDEFRFRLVGVVDVAVSTASLGTALESASNGTGGWAPIKAKRDEVGADIVTVLIDTGSPYGTTGLGVTLKKTHYDTATDTADSFSEMPYNACSIRSVAQSHTMTHEVGHNMGCGHATDQISDPTYGLFTYSSGYYYSHAGTWYHTIMAYGGECPYGDGNATQAPYFSDKWAYYDADTDSYFTPGDDQHDNYYTLYKTYTAASNWRASKGIDLESGYDGELKWYRTADDPINKAKAEGKKVFLVCGRDTCGYTQATREACAMSVVKRLLDQNFVCWYAVWDDEWSTISKYYKGYSYGSTFPFKAVIDPASGTTLKVQGGPPESLYLEDFAAQLVALLGDIPGVKYTLTRDPNGGTYQGKTAATVTADGLVCGAGNFWDIQTPTRSGYTFAGWYTEASGGTMVYDASGKCVPGTAYWSTDKKYIYAGPLTVYAHWATAAKYTLTRNPNGGTYQGKTTATVTANGLQVGTGNFWSIGVPTRDGYTFDGWWTAASGGVKVYDNSGNCIAGTYWNSSKTYIYNGDLAVYAHWTVPVGSKYTLTRNPNGGTYQGKTTATVTANGLQVGTGNFWSIGVPTRDGYTFDGWWTAASGGVKVYDNSGNCIAGTYWNSSKTYIYNGNLTVYAHWTVPVGSKYTLTRNPNGGTYQGKTTAIVTSNGLQTGTGNFWSIGVPTRDGYGFDGWWTAASGGVKVYDNSGNCIAGTYWDSGKHYIYNGNLTVYAHWRTPSGSKYTLTRNPNGGTYQGKTTAIVTANGLQTGTGNFWSIGMADRTGYAFDGWWTAASGGTKVYGVDGNCIFGEYWSSNKAYVYEGNLTVYAHWRAVSGKKYTLTRNPNGGTYQGKTTAIVTANGLQTGTGNFWSIGVPTRDGYAFDGWWTAASGGTKVYGSDGNCIFGDYWSTGKAYVHEGDLAVYAHWRAISGKKYTLTRNPNGGTYQGKTTAIVTANGLQTGTGNFWSIGMADRSGYAFDGWWTAASGGVKVYGTDGNCIFGDYWAPSKAYIHEGDLKVYAHWRALSGKKYTLTRDPNGGTYQGKTTAIVTANGLQTGTGNFWSLGVPTRSGYTFDGWWTAASGGVQVYGTDGNCIFGEYWSTGKAYTYEGNLTVYAHWKQARYTLTIDPNGGTYKGKTTATVIANALAYGSTDNNNIGVPTRDGYNFLGWYLSPSGGLQPYTASGYWKSGTIFWTSAGTYMRTVDMTVYAKWEETLAHAVDCQSLTFTTGGDSSWIVQSTTTHDGKSAVRSGAISDNQTSWLQTTVPGPGTIRFWWYVSCEGSPTYEWDRLAFYVDDVKIDYISGTDKGWMQVVYTITSAGSHTIRWAYIKDGSTTQGDDLGIIDQVVWTPASANISAQETKGKSFFATDDSELSLAELAAGTFDGVVFGEQGAVGTVALTVASNGAISGKVLKNGLVQTLSADEVTLAIDESAPFRRVVATGDGWVAWQNLWKTEPWKAVAEPFAEAPVLVTPDGVALKFSSTGAVTATYGAYSCSSVLIPSATTPNFSLFVYFPPKAGEFEGYAAEVKLVWDGVGFSAL